MARISTPEGLTPIPHSRPQLDEDEVRACERVIRSGYLASGPETSAFEASLSERFKRTYVVAVSSGMAALHLCLHALGAHAETKVFMPSYVCTALLNATGLTGAKPIFLDNKIDEVHIPNCRPALMMAKDVIIAPQMFGLCKSWDQLPQDRLIEDAAMALGPKAMSQGIASITSFYATKMMTTAQGGAIFTDSESLATELRDLIAYDNRSTYRQRFNYAPNDLSSAIGRVQLSKLDAFLERRQCLAERYDQRITEVCPHILAQKGGLSQHGPGLFRYWVKLANRDEVQQHLKNLFIESKSPVYRPLHTYFESNERFPQAELQHQSILSLPFYPALSESQVDFVVEKLSEVAVL